MSRIVPRHLHGGKWSQEEELYAAALMEAFKEGELDPLDCPEGTSLRKYLAKKLLCSPKRVSKKYEGTGYNGKQVYMKKNTPAGLFQNPALTLARQAKMDHLERKFLESLTEGQQGQPAKAVVQVNPVVAGAHAFASLPSMLNPTNQHSGLLGGAVPASDDSNLASLRALVQERDRLDAILSHSQLGAIAAPAWRSSAAVDLILSAPQGRSASDTLAMLLEKERFRQAALASNLFHNRMSLGISNPLGGGFDLLGNTTPSMFPGAPSSVILDQMDLENRLKRTMEGELALRVKRARLEF